MVARDVLFLTKMRSEHKKNPRHNRRLTNSLTGKSLRSQGTVAEAPKAEGNLRTLRCLW